MRVRDEELLERAEESVGVVVGVVVAVVLMTVIIVRVIMPSMVMVMVMVMPMAMVMGMLVRAIVGAACLARVRVICAHAVSFRAVSASGAVSAFGWWWRGTPPSECSAWKIASETICDACSLASR